ncbi:hypothetical protein QE152_g225 [Popillia japonica]|uniref:Uncharacterized protein n=1 Tax=Popillia japonica TaxID=7064 RepID=A0AAW1NM55_POPJA
MSKLLLVCVLFSFLALAHSELQCYNCTGLTCDFSNPSNRHTCGKGVANIEAGCLTFVYKEKSGTKNIQRKCVLLNPKEEFKCTLPADAQQESCNVCKENLCNSARGMTFNSFSLLAASIGSLLFVKLFS